MRDSRGSLVVNVNNEFTGPTVNERQQGSLVVNVNNEFTGPTVNERQQGSLVVNVNDVCSTVSNSLSADFRQRLGSQSWIK